MESSENKNKPLKGNVLSKVYTFSVPSCFIQIKEDLSISTNIIFCLSKEQIIKQAFKLHSEGSLLEAERYYQYSIDNHCNEPIIFSNLANILREFGKLNEAEISVRRAIELKPDFAEAYSNLGNILRDLGKLKEAELSTHKAIKLKPDYAEGHLNLGSILNDIGRFQEAEIYTRKAIKIKPDYAEAYLNLGLILKGLGRLKEAEKSIIKAIEFKPDYANAYYSISLFKFSIDIKFWKEKLFSKNILNSKTTKEKVDIYFARSNILHIEKNYLESAKYLTLANNLKLNNKPSNPHILFKKSKSLLIEAEQTKVNEKEYIQSPECIFIVGMPRSGSTLLESILSMNNNVNDLGENNILEDTFIYLKKINKINHLAELYWKKSRTYNDESNIITNKWLYNYLYTGIIASQIPNSKIIHCFRNPLDNILSIYRTHFAKGNEYASSLIDCAEVYLNQEKVMKQYKKRYRSKIYDLNYDLLVTNKNQEIKSLINWLGWEWDDTYLSPHLNPRSISTASSVQVRSPISSKSVGGWTNYRKMLEPAIEIFNRKKILF